VAKSEVMKITVQRQRADQVESDALIVPVFQGRRMPVSERRTFLTQAKLPESRSN
jgi:hypothetical protein